MIISFILGVLLGAVAGLLTAALLRANGRDDDV